MCKWFYFNLLCVAQQPLFLYWTLSFSTIYSIFCTKKVPFSFQFSRLYCQYIEAHSVTWSVSIIFYFWYNLHYLLHSLRRLCGTSSTDSQRWGHVPAPHPAFIGQEKPLHTWGELDAYGWICWCFTLTKERKIQRKHHSILFHWLTISTTSF